MPPRRHHQPGQLGDHQCQPFTGPVPLRLIADPQFPLKYQRDPWCWSPELGFHRSSTPGTRVHLRTAPGKRFVGPDFIKWYQALCLGFGLGTSNVGVGGMREFVSRFAEIGNYVRFTDAEPFARFGWMGRVYKQLPRESRTGVHLAVFQRAYRLIGPDGPPAELLGPWQPLLDRALQGLPVAADDLAWADAQVDPPGTRPGRRRPPSLRDTGAHRTLYALHDGGHGGNSRGLTTLFALTEPTEEQATRWLLAVGEAINQHVTAALR